MVKPRKDDKMSRIPRASGQKKQPPSGSIKSPRKPTTPQTPRTSLLPLPVRANHGLTPKKTTLASHKLSSDVLKEPVPEDETISTSIEPDNTKDENEKDENEKDDNIKQETDEDSWPEDTDPKFLAEAAEYRRRGTVFTGEYRVKRLTRSRLDMGPTLFIAPSAERLIMGTDDKQDVSSCIFVDQKLEEKTVRDPVAEESRVFDQQTATRDDRWSPQKEPFPPYVTDDTAVGDDNEQMMEAEFLEKLYEDPKPYVGESCEGEDKGHEEGVSTDIKSQHQGSVARDDERPVRTDSLPTSQNVSERQGPGAQVISDIKSQFHGPATRHDGWPVRIDSLPSFQKLCEGHRDESLSEQLKTDIKSQFQGPFFKGWPVQKDSLPEFRGSSEAHKDEGPGERSLSNTLPHSRNLDDTGRPDSKQVTRTSRIGPGSLLKATPSHAPRSPNGRPLHTPPRFHANLHPSPSVASRSSKNPVSSASRIGRLARVFSQSASLTLSPTTRFRSRNNPLLPKSFTESDVNRRSISSVLVPETPKQVKASPKKRAVEETRSPTRSSSTMKFPSSKIPRALEGVRGFISKSKTAKNEEAKPADKKKKSTNLKKISISSPQTPTMASRMSQGTQRGPASAHASVSTPQSVPCGSHSRTQDWSFARPTYSARQRAAANMAAKEAPSPSSFVSPSVASPPQNSTGPITKPPEDLWDTLVERSPRGFAPLDWDPKEDPPLPHIPDPVPDRHVEAVRTYIKRLRDMSPEEDIDAMAERITVSSRPIHYLSYSI